MCSIDQLASSSDTIDHAYNFVYGNFTSYAKLIFVVEIFLKLYWRRSNQIFEQSDIGTFVFGIDASRPIGRIDNTMYLSRTSTLGCSDFCLGIVCTSSLGMNNVEHLVSQMRSHSPITSTNALFVGMELAN